MSGRVAKTKDGPSCELARMASPCWLQQAQDGCRTWATQACETNQRTSRCSGPGWSWPRQLQGCSSTAVLRVATKKERKGKEGLQGVQVGVMTSSRVDSGTRAGCTLVFAKPCAWSSFVWVCSLFLCFSLSVCVLSECVLSVCVWCVCVLSVCLVCA